MKVRSRRPEDLFVYFFIWFLSDAHPLISLKTLPGMVAVSPIRPKTSPHKTRIILIATYRNCMVGIPVWCSIDPKEGKGGEGTGRTPILTLALLYPQFFIHSPSPLLRDDGWGLRTGNKGKAKQQVGSGHYMMTCCCPMHSKVVVIIAPFC